MATRSAKFVIVRTGAGHHVRLIGANAQPVFTTEPYSSKRRASRAIEIAGEAVEADSPVAVVDERPKA